MKKVAILQSNYIPWKGYFDIINYVDEFIIYDDMQYTKRDWRNRNIIKTQNGLQWLTIPVKVKGKYYQKINETKVNDKEWAYKHWKAIEFNYSKALFFEIYKEIIYSTLIKSSKLEYLSEINYIFIKMINNLLDIRTKIKFSTEFDLIGEKTQRLINICKKCNAQVYVSGPSAKSYFDEELAKQERINVEWVNYDDYKEYNQLFPPFEHKVSIIDLLFNEGINSKKFMKTFND